ncbi:MAG: tetratricopeptide repeat protein [Verrucomicrobia bacterium]|nr:tetratricopeptide repeat protein [Verrucomicrobiota bacterium]
MSEQPDREVAVFNAAVELPAAERAAYLDKACAVDTTLRQQVEALLRAHDQAEGFMEAPAGGLDDQRTASGSIPLTEKPGDRIGRYKLLQQIGEGGCGVVYMAEQEEPVRRRVALKVLKLGMDTKQVIARFEAERQALALMDHPNIAKVLDAGATETGRPYFVMELVRGIKITDFCEEKGLSIQERLRLFIQVCQAIQHAHQKGVIHRDIKPSNILVTVNDSDAPGCPKVIDFGIAKATQGRLTDQTLFTAFQQFIGTPAYMSPEQAVMTSLDIDTRSDIYSLGVLLYELLTGCTPFDQRELLAAGLDEMRRTIREKEPLKPSTRLTQELAAAGVRSPHSEREVRDPKSEEAVGASSRRLLQIKQLVHVLRGDLDWIVMKCLEKDRTRRYETANGLTMDLRRHLNSEPVLARPPSRLYRVQKLVRRNKLIFAAIAAVLTALLLGLAVSTFLLLQQRSAQRTARSELQKSLQVTTFLQGMLEDVSPEVNQGRETKVRDILDRAVNRSSIELTNQPEIHSLLLSTIAGVYDKLGDFEKAETLCREALRQQESAAGPEHESIGELLDHLGFVQTQRGDLTGAATSLRRAVGITKKHSLQRSPALVDALANLANLQSQSGDLSGAERTLQEALDVTSRVPEAKGREVLLRSHLGRALWARGDLAVAENSLRETLELAAGVLPADHPLVATTLGSLGLAQWERGELDAAEKSLRDSLDRRLRILGNAPHPEVANSLNNLALVLRDRGRLVEAEKLQHQALDFMMQTVGPLHPDTGHSRGNLADILRRRGALNPDQALQLFIEALQLNPNNEMSSDALACHLARSALTSLTPEPPTNEPVWLYTSTPPPTNWALPDFSDSAWASQPAPHGFPMYVPRSPRAAGPRTNLWLRREFDLPSVPTGTLAFLISRNHDARIFVNGTENTPATDWSDAPVLQPCSPAARAALKPGRNVLAVHGQDADGNAPIEVGLFATADPSLGRNQLIEEFSHRLAQEPQRADLYAMRGSALVRLGRFGEAANDLRKAVELLPSESVFRVQFALLLLATNDVAGYRRLCGEGLKNLARPGFPQTAERIASIALLLPADGKELEVAAKLADQVAAADYSDDGLPARQWVKGLAEYRRGRFEDAIDWFDKAIATCAQPNLPGWKHERQRNLQGAAYLVQAMAYHRLGRKGESSTVLGKGVLIIQGQFPALDSGDLGRAWPGALTASILLREARQLTEGTPPPRGSP